MTEAVAAEKAGADALIIQGHEAGGHRGNFLTPAGESVGLMSLIPAVADAVSIPLIATGGIADKEVLRRQLCLAPLLYKLAQAYCALLKLALRLHGQMPLQLPCQKIR